VLFGQREVGLFSGGIVGASALVAALGLLARSPMVRSTLGVALTASSAGSLLGALFSYWRNRSGAGWIRAAIGLLASAFVTLLARPRVDRPSRGDLARELQNP